MLMKRIMYGLLSTLSAGVLVASYFLSFQAPGATGDASATAGMTDAPGASTATRTPDAGSGASGGSPSTGSAASGTGSGATGSTGSAAGEGSSAASGSGSAGSDTTGTGGTAQGSPGSQGAGSGAASVGLLNDGSYTGAASQTRYGAVQVAITVSGGQISDVQVPVYPSESGRDRSINSRAVPVLVQETLSAQSASIHMVSGATYTSTGYLASLQSAIDAAKG